MDNSSFIATIEDINLRLDKLLSIRFPHLSRSYFQYLFENKSILLNGHPPKKKDMVKIGDEVQISFLYHKEISLEGEDIPLKILYEDDHIIAVNKPPSMVVHPGPGHYSGTFVNALIYHCKNLANWNDTIRPGIVHRLDKDTSGVILAAKTIEAHQNLITAFSNREISKFYEGISFGNPGERKVCAPIGRHPKKRIEMCVIETGKEAITEFRPIQTSAKLTHFEAKLITGRTHQIRVHLKHINTPLLGDALYGSNTNSYGANRQMLHAKKVEFSHPITKENLVIMAPIPKDMENILKNI